MIEPGGAAAIIVAAGASRRMGGIDKVLQPLAGRPVLLHSLDVIARHPAIGAVVIVTSAEAFPRIADLIGQAVWPVPVDLALGGARRQDSVAAGLRRTPASARWIVIHDAARPFVDAAMLDRGLAAAEASAAAVAAMPARDTAKLVGPDHLVRQTVERSMLWLVQTPQVFRRDRLEYAFAHIQDDVTDEATMVERCGQPVRVFEGSPFNLKLTVPEDLPVAEAIARHLGRAAELPI